MVSDDLDDAWLVVAATDNPLVNDQVAAWAEARRIWCIHAGEVAKGTARMAATSTHGDLTVGVVSKDAPDPGRIRAVRDAVAAHIDAGSVDLRRSRPINGRVILVGSGPGDPGLMTVRGRQALAEADVVVTDRLGATELLTHLPYDVEVVNVGKSPDNHPVPQDDINALLVEHAQAGRTVVRLKGGDPFVFGRGGEEVAACIAAGIPVEVVPGVTSAIAVPGLAGIPVTQRGVTASVLIASGHAGADAGGSGRHRARHYRGVPHGRHRLARDRRSGPRRRCRPGNARGDHRERLASYSARHAGRFVRDCSSLGRNGSETSGGYRRGKGRRGGLPRNRGLGGDVD